MRFSNVIAVLILLLAIILAQGLTNEGNHIDSLPIGAVKDYLPLPQDNMTSISRINGTIKHLDGIKYDSAGSDSICVYKIDDQLDGIDDWIVARWANGSILAGGTSRNDDQKILQEAISNSSAHYIEIGEGLFTIHHAWHIASSDGGRYAIKVRPNSTISGIGMNSTILRADYPEGNSSPFDPPACIFGTNDSVKNENILIKDLTLDGNITDSYRNRGGAKITRCDNSAVLRVRLMNCRTGVCLSAQDYATETDHYEYLRPKVIQNCIALNCTSEDYIIWRSTNCWFINNSASNGSLVQNETGAYGWYMSIDSEHNADIHIIGNRINDVPVIDPILFAFNNSASYGIYLTDAKDASIYFNNITMKSAPESDRSIGAIYNLNWNDPDAPSNFSRNISIGFNHIEYGKILLETTWYGGTDNIKIFNNDLINAQIWLWADRNDMSTCYSHFEISNNRIYLPTSSFNAIIVDKAGIDGIHRDGRICDNTINFYTISPDMYSAIHVETVAGIRISGNRISPSPIIGIYLLECKNGNITDNYIEAPWYSQDKSSTGIRITKCDDTVCFCNYITCIPHFRPVIPEFSALKYQKHF